MTPSRSEFLEDQKILAIDLNLRAGPLAKQNAVPRLHVERLQFAALVARAGSDGDHFALLRLLFGGVGNNDAALGLFLALHAPEHDAVMQWTKTHASFP